MGSKDYSRGLLALNILEGKEEAPNLDHFLENGHNYNGVNLLYGNMKEKLCLASNYEEPKTEELAKTGSLSNTRVQKKWGKE